VRKKDEEMKGSAILILAATCGALALAEPENKAATPPTKSGTYQNGEWRYEYSVGIQGKAAICRGRLEYKGQPVSAPVGTITNTPVGKFVLFPYDQGWLNTRFGDPVFKPDGNLRDDLVEFFDQVRKQQEAQNNTSEGIRRPADGSPKPSR
jgi:hypothetical protein